MRRGTPESVAVLDVERRAEVGQHDAQETVALCGVGFEGFEDGLFHGGRDVRIEFPRRLEACFSVELFSQDVCRSGPGEGFLSGQDLIDGDAVGEDVGPMVDGFPLQLLG